MAQGDAGADDFFAQVEGLGLVWGDCSKIGTSLCQVAGDREETNFGDTAGFTAVTIVNDASRAMVICRKYTGKNTGTKPTQVGTGADDTNCIYVASDLIYRCTQLDEGEPAGPPSWLGAPFLTSTWSNEPAAHRVSGWTATAPSPAGSQSR
ncbi:MAG TPA: hypothetical protein VFV67_02050 [Actinophytocola sp.]|uniref:hypothetical protein n=1 Tax=Actinophytocola sp. TaxID=1872138 RepID=UPI002DB6BBF9|nr:hypothetical protein [Actinophytocola sp.]HEU5469407.1 hypothetical protein [Actinophytocola sp.]